MDPSIMKLLEEDEDETMHSGADVDAFQAALNRDIGGDVSTSQPLDSGNLGILSHESNQASSQPLMNWQASGQDSSTVYPSQTDLGNVRNPLHPEQHSSAMELTDHGSSLQVVDQQNDASHELSHLSEPQMQSLNSFSQGQFNQNSLHVSQSSGMQISEKSAVPVSGLDKMQSSSSDSQSLNLQKSAHQVTTGTEQSVSLKNQGKQIPFVALLPALKPHLDKDREIQLQNLFNQLRRNDIAKDQFVRLMRNVVGDQVLRLAVAQLQLQQGSNRPQSQPLALARQQNVRMPVGASMSQFTDSRSFEPHSAVPGQTTLNHPPPIANPQTPVELERPTDMHGNPVTQMSSSNAVMPKQEREHHSNPMQVQNKQQQMHFQYPQTSFSMYGSTSGNYNLYSGTNVSGSASSIKPQSHDPPIRPMLQHQALGVSQSGGATQTMNMVKFERQNIVNDPTRVHSGSASFSAAKPSGQPNSVPWQAPTNKDQSSAAFTSVNHVKQEAVEQPTEQKKKTQMPNPQGSSAPSVEQGNSYAGSSKDEASDKQSSKISFSTSSVMPANSVSPSAPALDGNVQGSRIPPTAGGTGKTPPKKPTAGQKKPLDSLGSPPPSSKKQKVSGGFSDQSIEQLNDVTAVSGVNLIEEEEQLFSVPKEDSRVSEASRKVVQEEEERLILERVPLQKKLAEIMAKFGLKNISNDVERCLSQCVEERLRGLLCNMIRLSKQRVDAEKARHRTVITSDVRQQIMMMNQKAKEEWERKQAEAEKLRKVNEPDSENKAEGDKEKDEGRARSVKVNKEEDDKMRTNAANVAARKAAGVDDMLSKWQLMAQARQKSAGGSEVTSGSQPDKDVNRKSLSTSGRSTRENHEGGRRSSGSASGANRKFGRNQVIVPQTKVNRPISVKDVIAALEREPQMSKSTLLYRLYERIQSDTPAE